MSRTRLVAVLVSLAVALALALGTLGLHREVLLGRSVYHMDDAADGYYPSHVAITRSLEAGRLPLWERNASAGWPLIADPYYGTFYPPNVLFLRGLFGPVRGLGFSIALHVLGAGLAMYWLLRRRQISPEVALLGAASLAFGGFMVVRIRHIIFAQMMAYLPLLLCGVEGFLTTKRARELVLIAAALGLSLLCGALPLLPYAALLVTAYVLPRCFRAEETWRGRLGVLVPLGAAALCGLLLAGAQLVPTVAHLPLTPRSLGASFQFAASYAWPDWGYVGTLLLPDLYGGEQRHEWFGRFNHWEMAGYYAGAWVVLLAPLALFQVRGRRRAELWGLAGVSVLAVLLALGTKTPLLRWFFDHVPLFGALRCPTRALVMWLLAAPILAAEALHAHLAVPVPVPVRRRSLVAVAVLLALGGVLGFFALRRGVHAPNVTATLRAVAHFTLVLGLGAAVLVLQRSGRLRAPAAAWALSLLTLIECVALGRTWVQPKPADWAPGTERFAALDWLLKQPRPEGSAVADRMSPLAEGPFRLLNVGMTYDRESASGYDSMLVWRYGHLIWILNNGKPYPHKLLEHDLAATVVKNWSSPLVDLLNIRYILAPYPLQPHWIERYAPSPTEPLHARHEPLWDQKLRVFENPRALPRAFVIYDFEVHPDEAGQAQALVRLDPRKKVLLDREPVPAPAAADRDRPLVPARVTSADATHLRIEAATDVPGVLVLSETSYPGWTAKLDGREAPILRADYAFRGITLPAGKHVVEMSYRSRPVQLGLWASGLGGLGLFAMLGAGAALRARKRRRSADEPAPAAPAAAAEPSPTASPPGI